MVLVKLLKSRHYKPPIWCNQSWVSNAPVTDCFLLKTSELCGILAGTFLLLSRAWVLRASVCLFVCIYTWMYVRLYVCVWSDISWPCTLWFFRLTLWCCGIMWHVFRLRISTCSEKTVGKVAVYRMDIIQACHVAYL
jgi:hypothetical protein